VVPDPVRLARAQGAFNVLNGTWPLLGMRSFEMIFGPKQDDWLVRTVAGLLVGNGVTQVLAATTPGGWPQARRVGVGTALTLLAIDLWYVPAGRIAKTYLLDAVAEAGWLIAWSRTRR
jgi:hypothetical protein